MKKTLLAVIMTSAVLLAPVTGTLAAIDKDFNKKFDELYNQLRNSGGSLAESDNKQFTDFYNKLGEAQKSHFEFYYDSVQGWITIKAAVFNLKKANDTLKNATGASLKPALENFIVSYNGFKEVQIALTRLGSGDDFGGPLIGNPTLMQIERQLRDSLLTTTITPGTINSLGQLGITLSVKGKYDVDQNKLSAVVSKEAKQIVSFLRGDGQSTGVTTKMGLAVDNALRKDGLIDSAIRELNDEVQAM